jgi:hypothetical protein
VKEPRRWLEDSSGAPPGARELLRYAAPTAPIDKQALSVSALLVAKVAATPSAAATLPLVAKLVASVGLFGAAAAVCVQVVLPAREPPRTRSHEQPPATVHSASARDVQADAGLPRPQTADLGSAALRAPDVDSTQPEPVPRPVAKPAPVRPAARTSAQPQATLGSFGQPPDAPVASAVTPQVVGHPQPPSAFAEHDSLALEVRLLDSARARLEPDPAQALRELDLHAAQFPQGMLAAERELIAVDALQRLGRSSEAEQHAQEILRRFPGNMYRQRVRSLLATPP